MSIMFGCIYGCLNRSDAHIVYCFSENMGAAIPHLVLLGDSTLDNRFYVGKGNPAIIDQLQLKVAERGWKATSVAVDGHSISHMSSQLSRIPQDATHLFISIGTPGTHLCCFELGIIYF
jgi:hypothetical protein